MPTASYRNTKYVVLTRRLCTNAHSQPFGVHKLYSKRTFCRWVS